MFGDSLDAILLSFHFYIFNDTPPKAHFACSIHRSRSIFMARLQNCSYNILYNCVIYDLIRDVFILYLIFRLLRSLVAASFVAKLLFPDIYIMCYGLYCIRLVVPQIYCLYFFSNVHFFCFFNLGHRRLRQSLLGLL